ncbi:MAG: hypothetical protein AAGG75_09875 [Bacteroidota bacterium]
MKNIDRRQFIENLFKLGVTTGLMTLVPLAAHSRHLEELLTEAGDIPYVFDLSDRRLRQKLERKPLAPSLRDMVFDLGEGKQAWFIGEGRNNLKDTTFYRRANCRINKSRDGFTPVTLLQGSKHEVYGQFVNKVIGRVGIIRGFDGRYHCVYPNFEPVFSAKYQCYGLPADSYEVKVCRHCKETYIKQDFQLEPGGRRHQLYSWWQCKVTGGAHDDLQIEQVEPCGVMDNVELGVRF